MDHFLPKMLAGFLIRVISIGIWIYKCTGVPIVSLTASSSPYIDIGGSMTLTCSINEDVQITSAYLRKNGIYYVWIRPSTSSGCTFTKLNGGDQHVYNGSCEQNMKTIHIIINSTNVSDDNATWACSMAYQSCGSPGGACVSIANVTTALRVLVSSVQLTDQTGQPLVTQVSVLDGSNKDFRCDTSPNGSRPRALFKWYKRSENQSAILIQDQSISTPGPNPEFDLSISTSYSTLTLMGSRSYHNMSIHCEAKDETNRGNVTRSREVQLNIVYPPIIQLFPNTSIWNVTESDKFEFRCNVTDANPMPQPDGYSWLFGGRVLQGQNRSSLELFNVQKTQDGVYQCMARNEYGIGNSSSMHLNVHYAPVVKLWPAVLDVNPYKVKQGRENVVLVCDVVDAYPSPTSFIWTHSGTESQGGSNFTIPIATRQANGIWGCKGINGYGTPLESQLQVDVQYGPIIELIENKTANENQLFLVTCNIDSNPLPLSVLWTKDNNSTFLHNTSVLKIASVKRYDSGTYRCTAANTIHPSGLSEESVNGTGWFYLDVQYGVVIINLSVVDGNIVNENTTATLRCLVDSNPKSNITWTKQGILGNLQTNYSVHESQLIIEHAQCLDTFNYTCNANNGLGFAVKRNVPLYVTCHPRTDFRSPPVTKVYSKRYGNASLNYTVIAFPEPVFNWSFIGNGSESKHLPDSANKQDIGLQSILIFTNLSINDFGFYRVIANNSFPTSATEVFNLTPADVPDIPSNVTVTDIKQTSLTVHWVAGFNGGLQQTFQINVTANDIPRSLYAPDPGEGKSGTQIIDNLMANTEYNISMTANNSMGSSSVTNVIKAITFPDVPDMPSNVTVTDIRHTSLTVHWVAGFNGGLQQTFHIIITIGDFIRSLYAPDPGYGKSGTQTIVNLMANTEYSISMSANNSMGSSSVTNVIKVITLKEPDTDNPNKFTLAAVLGGIGAGVGVILVVALVVFLVRRYRHLTDEQMYENAAHVDGSSSNVYEGLSNTSGENAYDTLGTSNGTCIEKDSLMYVNLKLKPFRNKNGEPNIGRQNIQTEAAQTVDGLMGEAL